VAIGQLRIIEALGNRVYQVLDVHIRRRIYHARGPTACRIAGSIIIGRNLN
jgi:hypothetical protein